MNLEINGKVATLILNRQKKRNALDIALMQELLKGIESVEKDESVRLLQIRGAGGFFCSGLDLELVKSQESIEVSAHLLQKLLLSLYQFPKPTMAIVEGVAFAGGVGLLSVCDIIIVESETKFSLPEVRRGLVPAFIMVFLRRQLLEKHLNELILLGDLFSAQRALEIGLITKIASKETLEKEVQELTESILKGAPFALIQAKRLLKDLQTSIIEELKVASHIHRLSRESKEAEEGVAAFFEKRPPSWI